MTSRQGILSFKLDVSSSRLGVTAFAGLPLLIELLRVLFDPALYRELCDALHYQDWKVPGRHLESLLLLVAAGGDHIDDLEMLRQDPGLEELLGFELSSPAQARDFLYRFHQREDGHTLTPEEDATLGHKGKANFRPEGPGLRLLDTFLSRTFQKIQDVRPSARVTLDVDATLIESHKKQALMTCEGVPGYQPQMAFWAEQGAWVCDQFRDGNVNAEFQAKEFLQRASGQVPVENAVCRLRADSALYNEDGLTWLDEQHIMFVVSADLGESLERHMKKIAETDWKPCRTLSEKGLKLSDEIREYAEVTDFVPGWKRNDKKDGRAFRYIAIRVRSRQQDLFASPDSQWRHFAVVTNNYDWNGERLLRWHREKQGTVEHGHGTTRHDLAGAVMPCARFGSNAAWWRLNVLVFDLLVLLKQGVLPADMALYRPKALRLRLFNVAGLLVRHARQTLLKLSCWHPIADIYARARLTLLSWLPVAQAP
jgi:hypothetical protein